MIRFEFRHHVNISSPGAEVPVRLQVAGIDLLGWESEGEMPVTPWLPLSLIPLATWGRRSVRLAETFGRFAYDLDEYGEALLFVVEDRNILVHSTMREVTVQVPISRLRLAWEQFADTSRVWLVDRFPYVNDDPRWRIDEYPDPSSLEMTFEAQLFEDHEACFARVNAVE